MWLVGLLDIGGGDEDGDGEVSDGEVDEIAGGVPRGPAPPLIRW